MYFCSMLKNRYLILISVICLMAFASCGNHTQILKSTDNEYKYNSAMHYYGQKDYNRALQLFDVLQSAYRGKPQGEEIAYYTAECYYNMKDYDIASHYYKRYAVNYPFAKNVEAALFRSACCYYLESPSIELDQEDTYMAIKEFQSFKDLYPQSVYADSANRLIETLENKIVEKDFNTCMLYYKMEEFQAAITSFERFLKANPTTIHREEIINYMVLTYAKYAEKSVLEKQRERYELALEKYNTLTYMYPDSKYVTALEPTVEKIRTELSNIKTK